ncbi:hypothetical protein ACFFSW_35990 [Saccharothrix longispora]|uniref:Uncharacterized protein n=1 Tax=Saccharothrix longispora TaxID=33920 RepID=A0ABU1PP56_9PSEU|nr:hypothetical protein [Saccharothrix longispora]MDR6591864.1 hypothetical protein [Saccharothrix longispora]
MSAAPRSMRSDSRPGQITQRATATCRTPSARNARTASSGTPASASLRSRARTSRRDGPRTANRRTTTPSDAWSRSSAGRSTSA